MVENKNLKVNFLHPINTNMITVTLDNNFTSDEVIRELIANNFIKEYSQGYSLSIKGGHTLHGSETFATANIKDGDMIRIIPITDAGGGQFEAEIKSSIPGLQRKLKDTFTIKDIQSSPQVIIMIVNMFDDLQLRYEQQSKLLSKETARSNDRFVSTILLLISQVVISIGANLITSNSAIAIPVMVAGVFQSALALYFTFRKRD